MLLKIPTPPDSLRACGCMAPRSLCAAVVAVVLAPPAGAANWKQLTGKKAQNYVRVNEYPSSSLGGGWGPRWGAAVASMDMTEEEERQFGKSKILLLGGDDFNATTGLGGLHNDVYFSQGEAWKVYEHPRDKNKNGDPLPRVVSKSTWTQVVPNRFPPVGTAYRQWISCDAESTMWGNLNNPPGCDQQYTVPGMFAGKTRFSPRRNHAAVVLRRVLYVVGGRALSGEDMPELETVGGILNPRFQDTAKRAREAAKHSKYGGARGTRWRQKTVLKNDVWLSIDGGIEWTLANPGCLVPQHHREGGARRPAGKVDHRKEPSILRTNTGKPFEKAGAVGDQCKTSGDCYGNAECHNDRCACEGPSPRENHALTIDEQAGKIYLYGGFVDRRVHNCGVETVATGRMGVQATNGPSSGDLRTVRDYKPAEPDLNRISGDEFECGSGFRGYMSDVWQTEGVRTPGTPLLWRRVTRKAPWAGRGGHVAFIMESIHWIVAGRTGHTFVENSEEVLNDVWYSRDGGAWEQRKDFSCTNEPLVYGQRKGIGSISCPPGATKSWQAEFVARDNAAAVVIPKSVQVPLSTVYFFGGQDNDGKLLNDVWSWRANPGTPWNPDFGPQAVTGSHYTYLDSDSKIEQLRLKAFGGVQGVRPKGMAVDYLSVDMIEKLNRAGIATVGDLAGANRDTVLHIRLHPNANERVESFCDVVNLAKAVLQKCATKPNEFDDTQQQLARKTTVMVASGKAETAAGFAFRNVRPPIIGEGEEVPVKVLTDFEKAKANWDGCQQLGETEVAPATGETVFADIDGVAQVQVLKDPWYIEEWLTCKSVFPPRSYHKGVRFKGQVYLVGGRSDTEYFNDMWVRDPSVVSLPARLPPALRASRAPPPTTLTNPALLCRANRNCPSRSSVRRTMARGACPPITHLIQRSASSRTSRAAFSSGGSSIGITTRWSRTGRLRH